MITSNPPATWDGYQLVNPEKLNENIGAARDQLGIFAAHRWNRSTVMIDIGTVTTSAEFRLPAITGVSYIVDRITVYGTVVGTTATLFWNDQVIDEAKEIPLNEGSISSTSPSRGTALPGFLISGTDWSNTFTVAVIASTSTVTNVQIEVGLRVARSSAVADPYTANLELYQAGDVPTAARFTAANFDLDTFAAAWTAGQTTYPVGLHYVDFQNFTSSTAAGATRDALPGSGPEKVIRILADAELDSAGSAGQDVFINASYGNYTSAPTAIGNFSVVGGSATYSSGTIALSDSVRDPTVASDDFVVQATTDGTTNIVRCGIWIVKNKNA